MIYEKHLLKRATCMIFTENDILLVGDEFGEVFSFSLDDTKEGTLLLGHVSQICDIQVDSLYIITADRDEKIRVSLLKAPFVIESFCLGHLQFVSQLGWLETEHVLISGGGDMKLMAWDIKSGTCLASIDTRAWFHDAESLWAISALGCLGSYVICTAEM
jgi:tRNA (guanine-N(7)-)-methyltransferase subunit TRM82